MLVVFVFWKDEKYNVERADRRKKVLLLIIKTKEFLYSNTGSVDKTI